MSKTKTSLFIALGFLFLCGLTAGDRAASMELYGTFHSMGVIVSISASDDPDSDAAAALEYRKSGSGASYTPGHPLSRVETTRFVGSLFLLDAGTSYDVRVTFTDPDGLLHNTTVQSAASTRAEVTIPSANNTYYVSPTGGGSSFTLASPGALRDGIDLAQPGDEVVLLGGTYYQGEIDLPRSGTAGAPIVIRGRAGETAELDGADPGTFAWTDEGGYVYSTTLITAGPHLAAAGGKRLYPYQSLADLQTLTWGIPGFFTTGSTLYVRLAGNAHPVGSGVVFSRYNYAFLVERDHIVFKDLTFRHYGRGSWAKAIYFYDADDNLVEDCTFALNDLGIGIKYGSDRTVIQDNEFSDTTFAWPWDAVKTGSELETGGVRFYDPATGRGTVIRDNTFHDYFDGLGVCPSATAGVTNETDVYENTLYRLGDDGLETDGQCSNVRIWGNTFYEVLIGISLAPAYTGPVYVFRNLIYNTGRADGVYPGSPFKFNSGYGLSGPMFLYHNTTDAVRAATNGLYIKAPGTWTNILTRNNIWNGTAYALENYNTSQPVDMDYDNLWNGQSGDLVRWDGTRYATLAAFSSATGLESHGLSLDPGFKDAGAGDYTPDTGSALIDKGVVIPGINDGFNGAAPDVGAFEAPAARDDFLGTWSGQGFYLRNSDTYHWTMLATHASRITAGDLDGDGTDDLIGIWPSQGGVWTRSSQSGSWVKFASTADWIASGDMTGDGRDDFLGSWAGQGVFHRNSANGIWTMMAAPADQVTAGDIDWDGIDDLIGTWPGQEGVFVKYSQSGSWVKIASTADWIASGDMTGDGRDDFLGSWAGQGVFYRDSANGAWTMMATPAGQVTSGDIDGDGIDDLIGTWAGQGGVFARYSGSGTWHKLASLPDWISCGQMRGFSGSSAQAALASPSGGTNPEPYSLTNFTDLSDSGPGGKNFVFRSENSLFPRHSGASPPPPGPGEPGFHFRKRKALTPRDTPRR